MADAPWWMKGVVYQVYPRSFQDSDGDGIGDLAGIRRRLDYLKWLGIDALWISPIYPSPMKDFGYDISDYCGVDVTFGTLADFDALIGEAHALGLKLILDFVPNHTSDQHPWFVESRASRTSPKRDWYIWRDPRPDGGPPNNWISNFGGSAWQFDEASGQYYYHAFLREQPDLNWRNAGVRAAMHDVLRFWLDRGVDGFRVDVIWHLIKDDQFRDNPPNPGYREGQPDIDRLQQVYSADRPEVHEVIAGLRGVLNEYEDRVLIGEIYLPIERLVTYYGKDLSGAQLPFNFQLLHSAWDAPHIAGMIGEYEKRCRKADGQTGCSAITTSRGSRAASVLCRRASRLCFFSHCAGRRLCITAMNLGSSRCRSRRRMSMTRGRGTSPVSVSGAIPSARPCNGTILKMRASRPRDPGCRLRRRGSDATSPSRPTMRICCSRSIVRCFNCAESQGAVVG